jgi:hypothetical protein
VREQVSLGRMAFDLVGAGWDDADTLGAVEELAEIEDHAVQVAEIEATFFELLDAIEVARQRITWARVGPRLPELRQALSSVYEVVVRGLDALDGDAVALRKSVREVNLATTQLRTLGGI